MGKEERCASSKYENCQSLTNIGQPNREQNESSAPDARGIGISVREGGILKGWRKLPLLYGRKCDS